MSILDEIVAHKRSEVASAKTRVQVSELRALEDFSRPRVSLAASLKSAKPMAVIAEVKRSSPSAGEINRTLALGSIAESYQRHGAAAVSVLTDVKNFAGHLNDLSDIRARVSLPLVRKDFIVDEYQIIEAKAYGADAVLLIAAVLEKAQLASLNSCAHELGLETLVEIYDESELEKIEFESMKLIGVNNRNLRTMKVNLEHTFEISRLLPVGTTIVSESGITASEQLVRLRENGIHAALIGEHLMKSPDPGEALATLLSPLEKQGSILHGRAHA